jgi:hypothetical protein
MCDAESVDCGSILALPYADPPSTFFAVAWVLTENVGSWEKMIVALLKVFVLANVTPALRMLDFRDG